MDLQNYYDCYEILSNIYEQVDGEVFYRYIFPNNENAGEMYSDFSHPNAVYLYKDERDKGEERRLRHRIMLNDTWSDDYMDYVERNDMALCSGLTYRSRSNKLQYAQTMNALIFDLDGVGRDELEMILYRAEKPASTVRSIPKPTFIVLSGHGVHLYYVLDRPIDLYPNIKIQLKSLKHDLTFRIWDYGRTSLVKSVQYQGIGQGFRMVGSINSKYGNTVVAFRVGENVSLEYLNGYTDDPKNRVDINRPKQPSKVDRAMAAVLYPEWYQRVVVEGNRNKKKWDIGYRKKKQEKDYALYEWWKRQITQVVEGHRYFFLLCLVIYACKCDVPVEKLKEDMQDCFETLRHINHNRDNELTQADVDSALECYSKDYYNFTIADIELLSGVRIERNKRNGRKQTDHVKLMNFVRDEINHNADWRKGNGRPSKQQIIFEWQRDNPRGRKVDCERETGLSKKTVLKWWNTTPDNVTSISPYIRHENGHMVATVPKIMLDEEFQEIVQDYYQTVEKG